MSRDPNSVLLLRRLAQEQHGVLTRQQAVDAGVSLAMQRRGVVAGTWGMLHGCLAVQPGRPSDLARATALQLQAGAPAMVSGPIALRLQGWSVPDTIVIVAAGELRRRRIPDALVLADDISRGVRVHRSLRLADRADALIDALVCVDESRARELLDHALQQRWITVEQWEVLVRPRRGSGRRGAGRLGRLTRQLRLGAHSEGERRLHGILRGAGISGWVPNWTLRGLDGQILAELDVAFPDLKVCIEVDGREAHSGRQQFERDRSRQNILVLLGWVVLRFTWLQLVKAPHWVADQVRQALRDAGRLPSPA